MTENKTNCTDETSPKDIPIGKIVIDEAFRVRERENQDLIDDFVELFKQHKSQKAGGVNDAKYPLPAVRVLRREGNEGTYALIAGFHRYTAAQKAGMDTILAKEFIGNEDQAFELALRDNSENGLRLSRGDLKVCIEKALLRFSDKSLEIVSNLTGASKTRCCEVKQAMKQLPEYKDRFPDKVTGKDGKTQSAIKKATRKPKALPEPQEPNHEPDVVSVPNAVPVQAQPIAQEQQAVSVPTPANDDDDIIRWERLNDAPIRTQISRYCHGLENLERFLESKDDKEYLYGKVRRWLDPLSPPNRNESNRA